MKHPKTPSFFDDGLEARKSGRSGRHSSSPLHVGGLCAQIEEALSLIFGGSCSDERLWDLGLLSVEPAPDSSRFLVKVYSLPGSPMRSVSEIQEILTAARPFLRREIAAAITRKRVPEVVFEVVPGPGGISHE